MAGRPDDCDAVIERLERHVNERHVARSDWVRSLRSDLTHLSRTLPAPPDDVRIEQVTADAPRLAPAVARLDDDYTKICQDIADVTAGLPSADQGAVVGLVEGLSADVDRYRQGVADLLHEAYDVDIGGED